MTVWTERVKPALSRLGDWLIGIFVVAGLLTMPFVKPGEVRAKFVGDHPLPPEPALALLLLALAIATFSLLRRHHVWVNPARLTWDYAGDRDREVRRRLHLGLLSRFAVVGYLFVASGVVLGWPDLPLSGALTVAAGFYAVRWASRSSVWVALAGPFLLALAGVLLAGQALTGTTALWVVVGVLVVAGLVPRREAVRREELVRGWHARVLRSVSAAFGDALALLPTARPVPMRLRGVPRFVVAGIAARRAALPLAGLLVLAIPVLHTIFPVVDPVWWTAAGAYFVLVPLIGGLAEITTGSGLRRWLPADDRELKYTAIAVLLVVALVWIGATVLFGLPVRPATPLAALLAAWSAVRTVTRPQIDYTPPASVDAGGVYLPVGLLTQVLRGPDLLVVGSVVLAAYFHSS
ncbi:DUF6297 family protein [Actinokineospora auranticolor]|uniref:ABC-2 type transport system permease protein n=1 Tax=Actinokineospora auranticolor TaxID=155976 RepID=A0A2S6GRV9_9PSEU|nr:DUF6297 family protein [Actinokineospora auranticolor]PPK67926.1 hypothetical protein CLV40_106157 [Actinokineospora auranticolor]